METLFDLRKWTLFVAAAVVVPTTASARAIWYVDDDAPNDPGPGNSAISDPLEDGSAAHPFDTIQEGIDAASSGDTVLVLPGSYFENVDLLGKSIILEGQGGEAVTIIDGSFAGSVVTVSNSFGGGAEITGFTIRNGLAPRGGGVYCIGTLLDLRECTITNNQTSDGAPAAVGANAGNGGHGGGVYSESPLYIYDCVISHNRAGDGGDSAGGSGGDAGHGGSGGGVYCPSAIIEHSVIVWNDAGNGGPCNYPGEDAGDGGHGGGVCAYGLSPLQTVLRFTHLRDNTAGTGGMLGFSGYELGGYAGHGGGVYGDRLTLENCLVDGNCAGDGGVDRDGGHGGGIYASSNVALADTTVRDNCSGDGTEGWSGGGAGGDGGGLCAATASIEDCEFLGNWTGEGSGHDYAADGGDGGGIWCESLVAHGTRIAGNWTGDGGTPYGAGWPANGGDGGGMYVAAAEVGDGLFNCTIENNRTGHGSDAMSDGGDGGDGGGLFLEDTALALPITNCRFLANRTGNGHAADYQAGSGGSGGAICSTALTGLALRNSLLCGNETGDGGNDIGGLDIPGDGGDGGAVDAPWVQVESCTIADNEVGSGGLPGGAAGAGGGLHGTTVTASNSILWGNEGSEVEGTTITVTYCDVEGGSAEPWFGTGCVDVNPLFLLPTAELYQLRQDPCQTGVINPCVDAGDPFAIMVAGATRSDCVQDTGILDMGYHYSTCPAVASATFRNAGANPASHAAGSDPVLGTTYIATVAVGGTTGHSSAWLAGYATSLTLHLGGGSYLLTNTGDPGGELLGQAAAAGPLAIFSIAVPNQIALIGYECFTQALHFGGVYPHALSNAQDLVLGF